MTETVNKPEGLKPEEKTYAMFCHLAAFAGFFIPFGNILGPLVVWLLKKQESTFVDAHGKESLNFQITMSIGAVISAVLIFVLVGFFLLGIIVIVEIILVIIATMKANNGEQYSYPLTIRFIK